jgi:hypothetical protein
LAFAGCLDEPRSAAELKDSYESKDSSSASSAADGAVAAMICNGADKFKLLKKGFDDITKAFAHCVGGGDPQKACGPSAVCQEACLMSLGLSGDCSKCVLAKRGCVSENGNCVTVCAPENTAGSTLATKKCKSCVIKYCQDSITPSCLPKTTP